MKKIIYCFLAVILLVGLSLGCAAPAPAPAPGPAPAPAPAPAPGPEPIVLKAVSFDSASEIALPWFVLLDRINARAEGELIIEYMGGPESIPTMEQPEALMGGVIDLNTIWSAAYASVVPEIFLLSLSKPKIYGTHDTIEERKAGGAYDFLREAHAREGMYFLGRETVYLPFNIYTNHKIEKIADLAGLKVASGGTAHLAFLEVVGAVPVAMEAGERYEGLERKTVDGITEEPLGALSSSYHEVAEYVVQPPYKTNSNNVYVMNLDSWNKLPKHLQDVIEEAAIFAEAVSDAYDLGVASTAMQAMYALGLEPLNLPAAEREFYTTTYNESIWERLEGEVSADVLQKIRELAERK